MGIMHYNYTLIGVLMQDKVVRCPRHTIQFSGYSYGEYIQKVLELLGITIDYGEWKKYETWTPY
jgi:hypothetical protein